VAHSASAALLLNQSLKRTAYARHRSYARFLETLAALPAQRIVVVGHYGFIHQLLDLAGAGQHHLHNCQWARAVWSFC
jgi:broad specificity phosphatase PhoE